MTDKDEDVQGTTKCQTRQIYMVYPDNQADVVRT